MFDPMFQSDVVAELILAGIAAGLAIAGFWWIRRIVKDIEDN